MSVRFQGLRPQARPAILSRSLAKPVTRAAQQHAFRNALATASAVTALVAACPALAGPQGGAVVDGQATIQQSGATTNINQSTNKAIINWQSFSIGRQETVNFNQPSASSATLNRVIGNEKSVIAGALNANGQVFIVNSNGILFTKSAQVNVGGLVASTLDISNQNFMAGNYVFEGTSTASVVNRGRLHAHSGGYISLLGTKVENDGVITATLGSVVMASGQKITLNFGGDSLIDATIDQGTFNALVSNKGLIKANGGQVIMTARAADQIVSAQVNNSGIIQARTMASLKGGHGSVSVGKIKLIAYGGTVKVSGKLDASAPRGGNGGSIETSGDRVQIADAAVITTKAANGANGTWLIDPTDFTITSGSAAQTSSGIGATTLENELANGNVVIVTSAAANGSDLGDIDINAALTWSSGNSLTLAAYNNINVNAAVTWSSGTLTLNAGGNVYVNAVMTATGTANFAANYGYRINADGSVSTTVTGNGFNADGVTPYGLYMLQGTSSAGTYAGQINFAGTGTVVLNGTQYTVIESASDLWGAPTQVANNSYYGYSYYYQSASPISANGNYVLGADITANTYDASQGFNFSVTPTAASVIGTDATPFTGNFNGFGHTINVNGGAYPTSGNTGLFGTIGATGVVSNLNLNGQATSGVSTSASGAALGAIADVNYGRIINTVATNAQLNYNYYNLYNTASVPSSATVTDVGGFVGDNYGTIVNSGTIGGVVGSMNIGGFVGDNEQGGSIYTSFVRLSTSTSGTVASSTTAASAGGFAGINSGLIEQSYTRSGVSLTMTDSNYNTVVIPNSIAAGFVGENTSTGVIDQSYVSYGNLQGPESVNGAYMAGFVGDNAGTITNSYTTAPDYNNYGQIIYTAGFAYINSGTISTSYVQLASYNAHTYAFVAQNNGGTTTNDYYSYKSDPSSTQTPTDGSTATFLRVAQASDISNFTGFDTTIWGEDTGATVPTGYQVPILRQLPVLIELTSATSAPTYGTDASQIVGTNASTYLTAVGLQGFESTRYYGANPLSQLSLITPVDGYIDAGSYLSGSVIASNLYSNIQGVFTVSPATLTLASGVVNNKTYDGTNSATVNNSLANAGLVGLIGGQTLDVTYQSATFNNVNAGSQTATVVFTVSNGTGLASDYTISTTATATINPDPISASFTPASKTYDGSANAVVTTQLNGIIGNDAVSLSWASALFSDPNAGQNKTVTMSGLALTGAQASNYTLVSTTLQGTATISPLAVQLYGTETSASSTSFAASGLYVKNAVPGDSVSLTGTVTLAGTATGVQAITDFSNAALNNPNYTLTGAQGSVYIGTANLVLDHVVYGTVSITQPNGTTTTITQSTNSAIIDWLRFSIASNETVNFVQPSSTSVILNRVTGNEKSIIDGVLNANGRVFIVNSNGILFSSTSEVNVGSLVASTLNVADTAFQNGLYQFATAGATGSITATGPITVADGGFIVLASGEGVTTSGSLSAPGGTEVIAAVNNMTLNPDSASPALTSYTLSNLSGVADIGGNLNVGAVSGNGGLIATVGDTVLLSDNLAMHTGTNGTWSFGQNADIMIGSGGIAAQFVEDALSSGNFNLTSYLGAISIDDAVTWSANTTLTLNAATNININAKVEADGANAGLVMNYGGFAQTGTATAGSDYIIASEIVGSDGSISPGPGSITLPNATESLTIDGHAYTLIENESELASLPLSYVLNQRGRKIFDYNTYTYAMAVTGYYALGSDIALTQTYSGPLIASFGGTLAGLGHTISGLNIEDTAGNGGDGLIGTIGVTVLTSSYTNQVVATGIIRDLGLTNVSITGPGLSATGGLAGQSETGSTISNVYVKGSISGGANQGDLMGEIGGLVGFNDGLINNSHVDIAINAPGAVEYVGGLVGWAYRDSAISYSSSTGSMTVQGFAFADGGFEGSWGVGGLVGWNIGTIDNSFANMRIIANTTTDIGGLVGLNYQTGTTVGTANITNSSSAGSITAENKSTLLFEDGSIGGLIGDNQGGAVSNVSSTTNIAVTAAYYLGPGTSGGLTNNEGNAYFNYVGGLIGTNEGSLYTNNSGSLTNGTYNGAITVKGFVDDVGGAVGNNFGGTISNIQTGGTIIGISGSPGTGTPGDLGTITSGTIGNPGDCIGNCGSTMTVFLNGALLGGTTGSNGNTNTNVPPTRPNSTTSVPANDTAQTNNNTSLSSLTAAQEAAQRSAIQLGSRIGSNIAASAANVDMTPNGSIVSTGNAQGVYSPVPPNIDDHLTIAGPPATTVVPTAPSDVSRHAQRTGSGQHRGSRAGSGAGYGATIRSIDVNGQHFNLQNNSGVGPTR